MSSYCAFRLTAAAFLCLAMISCKQDVPSGEVIFSVSGAFSRYEAKIFTVRTVAGRNALHWEAKVENLSEEVLCIPSFYVNSQYPSLGYLVVKEWDNQESSFLPIQENSGPLPFFDDAWQEFSIVAPKTALRVQAGLLENFKISHFPIEIANSIQVFKCAYFENNPLLSIHDIVANRPIQFAHEYSDFLSAGPIEFP